MGTHYRLDRETDRKSALASVGSPDCEASRRQPAWKTVFDKAFAVLALGFFAPLIGVVAALLYFKEGGHVLFQQTRIGQNGRTFRCLKFRTMVLDADQRLAEYLKQNPEAQEDWTRYRKLKDDPRVTCLGRFLRKTSLDELPQFWNVLRGDMSVVGPRPIVWDETWHYGSDFPHYLAVRPGITGLWQVSGRSTTGYDERVKMDVSYVARQSLSLDLKIIFKTIKVVLTGDGAC